MTIKRRRKVELKRIIAGTTAVLLLALLCTSYIEPNGFLMRLADQGTTSTVLRALSLMAVISVLLSRPPRSMPFRYALGAVSSIILIVAFIAMADYRIGIVDAIVYLQVSILLAIEALEFHPQSATQQHLRA